MTWNVVIWDLLHLQGWKNTLNERKVFRIIRMTTTVTSSLQMGAKKLKLSSPGVIIQMLKLGFQAGLAFSSEIKISAIENSSFSYNYSTFCREFFAGLSSKFFKSYECREVVFYWIQV